MKKLSLILALLLSTTAANADFFGGNDGEWKMGPNGAYWDESDWPQWTPMYWMEEMMDSFGFNDDNGGFGNNFGNNFGFNGSSMNYPQMQQPYGYPTAPQAYGQQQVPALVVPATPVAPK